MIGLFGSDKRGIIEPASATLVKDRDDYIRDLISANKFPDRLRDEAVKVWPELRVKIISETGADHVTLRELKPAILDWALAQLGEEERMLMRMRLLSDRELMEAIYRKLWRLP